MYYGPIFTTEAFERVHVPAHFRTVLRWDHRSWTSWEVKHCQAAFKSLSYIELHLADSVAQGNSA